MVQVLLQNTWTQPDTQLCAMRWAMSSAWLNSHTPCPNRRAFESLPRASQFDTCLRVVRSPARSVSQSAASAGEHVMTARPAASTRPDTSMSRSRRSPHSGHQPSRIPCGTANDAEQSGHRTTVTRPSDGVHNLSIRRSIRSSRSASSPADGEHTTRDHDLPDTPDATPRPAASSTSNPRNQPTEASNGPPPHTPPTNARSPAGRPNLHEHHHSARRCAPCVRRARGVRGWFWRDWRFVVACVWRRFCRGWFVLVRRIVGIDWSWFPLSG